MKPEQSSPQAPLASAPKSKKRLIWALICLIGPTALIIVNIFLYAIVNFIAAGSGSSDTIHTITNTMLFLTGAVATLTWLPGIIVGIILLATRK